MTLNDDAAHALCSNKGVLPVWPGDDSEDELHADGPPEWSWVYEESEVEAEDPTRSRANGGVDTETTSRPRRSHSSKKDSHRNIIGARLGRFVIHVGDTVALKADRNDVWVAIVTDFIEADSTGDDDERTSVSSFHNDKCARFMWLSSPREIYNRQKRRNDALPNERYITTSMDNNPLETIMGRASIVSAEEFHRQYPTGKVPRNSPDFNRIFVCRRGVNLRTTTYTSDFVWEEVFSGTREGIENLKAKVETETRATRKKTALGDDSNQDARDSDYVAPRGLDDDTEHTIPSTPRKRCKLSTPTGTPHSASKKQSLLSTSKLSTPTHKRIIKKRALEFTPLGTRVLSPTHTPNSTPHSLARARLHVSSVPSALPCREGEFSAVYTHLEGAITDGVGSCIYISGTPGTGKTATVREVVVQLQASVRAEVLDDFAFVEINGMKVTDPHQSYSVLWEAITGERVAPQHALSLLTREFSLPSPRRVPVVVLMDELDQLVTKSQSVMYNFFHWPNLPHARLIVIAVANTMDLPERTLSNKISSRLGLRRITFQGYTHDQLMKIIETRLSGIKDGIVDADAIQFASRKVAQVSGDARRALDMCRRAVEIAEAESAQAETSVEIDDGELAPDTPTKRARSNPTSVSKSGLVRGRVTIQTIQRAIRETTSSPLQQYLRDLPLASKVFLAAFLARNRRTGVTDCNLGDVIDEAKKIGCMSNVAGMREWLIERDPKSTGHRLGNKREAMTAATPRMIGVGAAATELFEASVVVVEERAGERCARVRLQASGEEIKDALKDDWDVRELGFTS